MGYETYFNGKIKLFDKKAIKIIKKMVEKNEPPFDGGILSKKIPPSSKGGSSTKTLCI